MNDWVGRLWIAERAHQRAYSFQAGQAKTPGPA
jgi:hypothetical protein